MSKKDDKAGKDKAGKDKAGKDKKGKGKQGKGGAQGGPSVATHPRARANVRRAKGWGGMVGFAIAAYLAHKASVPFAVAGARALAAGVSGYVVAWGCAVTVWRHLVLAELRAAAEAGRVIAPAPAESSSRSSG
jgi:hypothetical protein